MDLEKATLRYQSAKLPGRRRVIAFDIARHIHKKNLDPTAWLRRESMDRLAEYDDPDSLYRNFLKIDAWMCCSECQSLDGKRFTLETARASNALPNPGCRNELNAAGHAFCTCFWEIDIEACREARSR